MQSKQLYIRRKILLDGGLEIVEREKSREIERESDPCITERCIPKEPLPLGQPEEELK